MPILDDASWDRRLLQAMTEIYIAAFKSESRALQTAEPMDGSEIVIPIPASGW